MLVENFVAETFFYHLRYIFSPLFIVRQLEILTELRRMTSDSMTNLGV